MIETAIRQFATQMLLLRRPSGITGSNPQPENRVHRIGIIAVLLVSWPLWAQEPKTTAERTDYQETTRHADVLAFCEFLAKSAPDRVRFAAMGDSSEGRKLPLLLLADPPVAAPEDAKRSGKLLVFVQANIHAGEVDGKEGLLMLAREIAGTSKHPLLKNLILAFAPNVNPDGNEKLGNHRPNQIGPSQVGARENAQGRDLNRDFIKLETPEVQALVRFYRRWDPHIVIDLHTTNGSRHRYTLTYDGPRHPASPPKLVDFVRDSFLPAAAQKLEKSTRFTSYFYGNFDAQRTEWRSYPAQPRYGTQYVGIRGRLAILSESYAYASFRDRVAASREFVRACLETASEKSAAIRPMLEEATKPPTQIALSHQLEARPKPVQILGFEEKVENGKRVVGEPRIFEVRQFDVAAPKTSIAPPVAYLVPPGLPRAVEVLQRHGLAIEELREDIELEVQAERVVKIAKAERLYQGHTQATCQTEPMKASLRMIPAGTLLVRSNQQLGALASILLEARSEDGLATWNFLDSVLVEGKEFPILRLTAEAPMTTGASRPLAEDRTMNRLITAEAGMGLHGGNPLIGAPARLRDWLPDGEHFLQVKRGKLLKVHAATGRSAPLFDREKIATALGKLPSLDRRSIDAVLSRQNLQLDAHFAGLMFEHANDLYFAALDGSTALRLTRSPEREELATFSPDGKWVAFVREQNLFVVDLATQTERQLTTDGGGLIYNGKADWVYYEEVFNRDEQAYWWSPDSRQIAFLRFDDSPVGKFTVTDHLPVRQRLEQTPYPKAGDPNPLVRMAMVSVAGGVPRFADLSSYNPASILLIRIAWTPDSSRAFLYVQDRAQTWLDVLAVGVDNGPPVKLFRDQTKAWVDDPGEPKFLKNGSFLLASERSGWRHLYHFDADGKLLRQVTDGPWEVRTVHRVDETSRSIYFSGTRDSHVAQGLYRVGLDNSAVDRIGTEIGDYAVQFSPKGPFFEVAHSNHKTPAQVCLRRLDGTLVRRIDGNPVYSREEYRLGEYRLIQIPMKDGFVLEGSILLPRDFDPKQKYPVWFMTYGGPHAPTISDKWSFRNLDHILSGLGIVVFRCDPRSASGKGAVSTWTAYRQLGVQELKDIDEAIDWLIKTHPFIDSARIGMSGHSYGGFMTAFALTHSKKFCAGIAGAPVTDWRNYDSIYTERYMNTPQENPDGYAKASVVRAASNLHGRLLISHGTMDDNVHVQNSLQLVDALQRARKDFDLMLYPRARHGIIEPHYQKLMLDFIRKAMGR